MTVPCDVPTPHAPSRTFAHGARASLSSLGLIVVVGALVVLAREAARDLSSWWGILASVPTGVLVILLLGSLYEWLVHRFVYHAPSRVPILHRVFEIHQHGHHWHRFPPDRYVASGPVERIPITPHDPRSVCGSKSRRRAAWLAQYSLYLLVGVPCAFVPLWLLTKNPVFTATAVVTGLFVCYMFIRVHWSSPNFVDTELGC